MPDISALYPQAPQPQTNSLLANPLQTAEGLTLLQKQQMEVQGQRAFGQIYAKHVTPNGVDIAGILKDAAADPAASLVLPKYTTEALAQHGQMISNAQNWLALNGAQVKPVLDFLSSYNEKTATPEDIRNGVVTLKRIMPSIPPDILYGISHMIVDHPQGVGAGTIAARNIAIGPLGISGRVVGPPTEAGAPTTTTIGQANTVPVMPTGLPPGGAESAGVMQSDLSRARNYGQEIFPWMQALKTMEGLQAKGETFGPGSHGRQELESFAYTLAPTIARWAGVDPDKIAGYAETEKYLTQGLQQRAAGFGTHTDMQLATAASGSPNVHITDLAGIPLIKATIALRRMEQVQTLANANKGGPNYTANTAQWSAQQDPRAYMIDLMSPDQVKKLQSSLKGAERARFNASLKAAIDNGVIARPGS